MLSFYVFCAIVGLGLLALGALGGGEADELDVPDLEKDFGGSADTHWKKLFSMRALAYFAAGFGSTGVLLTLVGAGAALTLLLSLGMGGSAAAFVLALFGWLRSTEGGFAQDANAYIGAPGRVKVPIRPPVPGSVDIEHQGRVLTMRALAHGEPESDPSTWNEVLVVDVDPGRGILLVQPLDRFLADEKNSLPSPSDP
jgi:hypothetical protein